MPQNDFVAVDFQLAAASAPRPSYGVSLLLHNLTDAQDALFGGSRTKLLTGDTWAADLAAVGLTDGEAAYEAVQSHFSQPRKPEKAYLGRRGKDIAQVWTVVVPGVPADGDYVISVTGGASSPYVFTASGSTQAAVRTGLLAALGAGSAKFTAAAGVGAGDIRLTSVALGVPLVVQISSPSASMTASVTTGTSVLAVAQVWTMEINSAALGVYTLTVQTTTGQEVYTHIATSGATVTTIRDAIKALYDADPSDLFGATMTSVSTDQGTLTASLAGRPGTVSITSPASDATVTVTTANYGVADDWAVMAAANTDWYEGLLGSRVAAELKLSQEWVDGDGRHILGVQSSDADILTGVTTDIFSKLKSTGSIRTHGVQHHIDAEGVMEAWAGYVLTSPAGSISWVARPLTGLTARVLTASEAANLRAKEGSFLENFSARDQRIMNGGYSFGGRPIDITRAMDTLQSNVSIGLMDLIVNSDIIPYSKPGQADCLGVIKNEWQKGVEAGYAIDGTLDVTFLPIQPGTNDAVRGIMPAFTMTGIIQAGAYKIEVRGRLSQ
jgi:hypothetical protein